MDRIRAATIWVAILSIFVFPSVSAISLNNVDGFENNGTLPTNWAVYTDNTTAVLWTMATTNPYAGTYHAQAQQPGTSSTTYLQASLDTTGYAGVNVSYFRRLVGLDGTDEYQMQWFDGVTWYTLEATGANTADDATYLFRNFTLPAGAANNPNFKIRFSCMAGAVSEYCRVDNVTVHAGLAPNPVEPIANGGFTYEINNGSKGFAINIYAEYDKNGTMTPVNTTLVTSTESGYESGVTTGLYEAHFKNLPSTTSSILIRRGIEIAYDPNGIYWASSAGDDIIDANPNGAGDPDPIRRNVFVYPDAYGTGIDLEYHYLSASLKEYVIIDNRTNLGNPSAPIIAGNNLTLKLEFAIHNINNAELYVDGALWTENGKKNGTKAEFRYGGQTIFLLDVPYVFDSNGQSVNGWYTFRRTLGDLWVEQHIPFSWVNSTSRSYPIFIDPTTEILVNQTVTINLTDNSYDPLIQIILYNVTDDGNHSNVLILDPIVNDSVGIEEYAIDPSNVNYVNGTVKVNMAKGEFLYKCPTFNITTSTCEFNPANNETWIRVLDITPGSPYNFTIDDADPGYFEYKVATGEISTISASYVNATTLDFNITREGEYIILANWQQYGDAQNEQIYSSLFIDGSQHSERQITPKSSDPTKEYPTLFAFKVLNLSVGPHSAYLQHKGSGTIRSYMKNMRIIMFDVNVFDIQDMHSMNVTGPVTLTTSWANITTLNYTPEYNGTYLHMGNIEGQLASTSDTFAVRWYEGSTMFSEWTKKPENTADWYQNGFIQADILDISTQRKAWVQAIKYSALAASIRRARFVSFPLLAQVDPQFYNNATIITTTNATNWTLAQQMNFTPAYQNVQYLIIVTGKVSSNDSKVPISRVLVNGTQICESRNYIKDSTVKLGLDCMTVLNVSTTSPINIKIEFMSSLAAKRVEIRDVAITAFRITPIDINNMLCYPVLNHDWIISEPIICDGVTRTTGTGRTYIMSNGSLDMRNGANITTTGSPIIVHGSPWKLLLQRGCNLFGIHV